MGWKIVCEFFNWLKRNVFCDKRWLSDHFRFNSNLCFFNMQFYIKVVCSWRQRSIQGHIWNMPLFARCASTVFFCVNIEHWFCFDQEWCSSFASALFVCDLKVNRRWLNWMIFVCLAQLSLLALFTISIWFFFINMVVYFFYCFRNAVCGKNWTFWVKQCLIIFVLGNHALFKFWLNTFQVCKLLFNWKNLVFNWRFLLYNGRFFNNWSDNILIWRSWSTSQWFKWFLVAKLKWCLIHNSYCFILFNIWVSEAFAWTLSP